MLRYLETFFRNKWRIIIPAFMLLCCGASLVVFVTPTYGVRATIWTERSTYLDLPWQNPWQTVAQREAGHIDELLNTDTFSQAIVDKITVGPKKSVQEQGQFAGMIRDMMYVSPTGEHTVQISFWHEDPDLALAAVQIAIAQYNEVTADVATQQAARAMDFYKERIATYETTILPRANEAVQQYLKDHPEMLLNQRAGSPIDPTYVQLERQAELDRAEYERYQQRLDEVMTQSQAVSKNQEASFRILDAPRVVAGNGGLSKKTLLTFVGGGAALALGYTVLFLGLATELDRTLRNPEDVRHRLKLPVLEIIPDYTVRPHKGRSRVSRKAQPSAAQPPTPEALTG